MEVKGLGDEQSMDRQAVAVVVAVEGVVIEIGRSAVGVAVAAVG